MLSLSPLPEAEVEETILSLELSFIHFWIMKRLVCTGVGIRGGLVKGIVGLWCCLRE